MKVELITHTPSPEKVIASSARLCYSKSAIDALMSNLTEEKIEEFINTLTDLGHESPFEHVTFTFYIEGVSRALLAQLTRHRMASYCVSGDTKIYTSSQKTNKKTIRELYKLSQQYKDLIKVKCVDENTNELNYNKLESIVYSGIKPVYKLRTSHGYEIKTTLDHMFYTDNGYKKLKDLKVEDTVYINGKELYKDKEWLNQKYNIDNLSQKTIGEICGISKHTVRKWVKLYGLEKPMGSWSIGVEPPNKGKNKYNYPPMHILSQKMMGNDFSPKYNSSEEHHSWKGKDITISGGYSRASRQLKKSNCCSLCGFEGHTEAHHINKNPKDNSKENLIEVCIACHKALHKKETKKRIIPSKIISIEYVGEEETYDIEMPPPNHNFVANGFIVHNSVRSQRYIDEGEFGYVKPESFGDRKVRLEIPTHNEGESFVHNLTFEQMMDVLKDFYNGAKELGIEKEDARFVLPNACETRLMCTMNIRSLFNFFKHRCCNRSQWEIRDLANEMLRLCKETSPLLFSKAGASCTYGKCNEGKMSCGNPIKPKEEF